MEMDAKAFYAVQEHKSCKPTAVEVSADQPQTCWDDQPCRIY